MKFIDDSLTKKDFDSKDIILEQLEYPLPKLKTSIDKIKLITSKRVEDTFNIRNVGGSELSGKITCNLIGLDFTPIDFMGNNIDIKYVFDPSNYKKGDIIKSNILIISNGGEMVIPIHLKIVPIAIKTENGKEIVDLKDFAFFAKENPMEASEIFFKSDFLVWLFNINYPYVEMYEFFKKDPVKIRALDNFLIFNSLKNKATISILEKNKRINIKPFEKEPIAGIVPLKINGWGYMDISTKISSSVPWIKLMTDKITNRDFDENGFFEVSYVIYPALINKKNVIEKIQFFDDDKKEVIIHVSKRKMLEVSLAKDSYNHEDSGKLIIKNLSGKDLMLEIFLKDPFIKFEGRRYLISEYAEIPFEIKKSALKSAQNLITKQPITESEILVKTNIDGENYSKTLKFRIGNLLFNK